MGGNLIYYAIVFLIVAIAAAALGFGGVAGTAISGAHLLLMVAVVFIVVGSLVPSQRRGSPIEPQRAPARSSVGAFRTVLAPS